jgi:hypothetical protein
LRDELTASHKRQTRRKKRHQNRRAWTANLHETLSPRLDVHLKRLSISGPSTAMAIPQAET